MIELPDRVSSPIQPGSLDCDCDPASGKVGLPPDGELALDAVLADVGVCQGVLDRLRCRPCDVDRRGSLLPVRTLRNSVFDFSGSGALVHSSVGPFHGSDGEFPVMLPGLFA